MGRAAIAICLAASALGCASVTPLPYPPQRVELGAFSFLPFDEPGWLGTPSDDETFNAARRGSAQDESWVIVAQLRPAEADLTSDEILLARGREAFLGGPSVSSSGRYERRSADVVLWNKLGARCLRLDIVVTDREPVRSSGSRAPMEMSTVTFFCIHPRSPSHAIMLGLSQRCDEGKEDAALGARAEALASTLEFLDETP